MYKTLVENSIVSVYIFQDNRFVYVNPSMCLNSGYTKEEFYNLPVKSFVYPEDLSIVEEKIKDRLTGKSTDTRYEVRVVKKDGTFMWVDVHGTTILYNDAPAIIGTMIDITEKRENYEKLAKAEANIRTIFDSSEIFYLMLDVESNIISFNAYFKEFYKDLTGYTVELGKNFFNYVLPERKVPLSEIIGNVIHNGKRSDYEVEYHSNTNPRYYYNQFVPVHSNGKVIGVCLSGLEITEKKKIEIEREKVVEDLMQRNRDLEQFSFMVSHNLRAPVANLLGLSSLLSEKLSDEELKFAIDSIKQCSVELDSIITDVNDVLNFRRNVKLNRSKVQLETILKKVTTELNSAIKHANARIEFDFTAIDTIVTVSDYLYSIFYHLISNAIKHSKPNIIPELKVWSEVDGEQVSIYFKDNGIGIDMETNQSKLFNLYSRINLKVEGKGLGLFMVKSQTVALNGKIKLESELGKGTTAILTLPMMKM